MISSTQANNNPLPSANELSDKICQFIKKSQNLYDALRKIAKYYQLKPSVILRILRKSYGKLPPTLSIIRRQEPNKEIAELCWNESNFEKFMKSLKSCLSVGSLCVIMIMIMRVVSMPLINIGDRESILFIISLIIPISVAIYVYNGHYYLKYRYYSIIPLIDKLFSPIDCDSIDRDFVICFLEKKYNLLDKIKKDYNEICGDKNNPKDENDFWLIKKQYEELLNIIEEKIFYDQTFEKKLMQLHLYSHSTIRRFEISIAIEKLKAGNQDE